MLCDIIYLAKKYHPDALKAEKKTSDDTKEISDNEQEKKFKQITEAYSILSNTDLRKKYDRLIFGASSETSQEFSNQSEYNYWSQKGSEEKKQTKSNYERSQREIKERLAKYKDYKDFLKTYENHKEKHDARSTLFREEGFRDLHEKYGPEYDHYAQTENNPNHEKNENYHIYRERFENRYWDTKANHEYYS